MAETRNGQGIALMIFVCLIFAIQDALSRYLAGNISVFMIMMLRYWFFAAFVCAVASRSTGGLRHAFRTGLPFWQLFRGVLLAGQISIMVFAFSRLGLSGTHAIFSSYPLLTTMLAVPILGEVAGWRRWTALGVGFIGVLIVLRPDSGTLTPLALIPLAGAFSSAVYNLLTRYVAREDNSLTSVLWTSVPGAVVLTPLGLMNWTAMTAPDWGIMALLCITSTVSHWLLIRIYEIAEVAAVQPFSYAHLVFATLFGVIFFHEVVTLHMAVGTLIIVSASIFTLLRARQKAVPLPLTAPDGGPVEPIRPHGKPRG